MKKKSKIKKKNQIFFFRSSKNNEKLMKHNYFKNKNKNDKKTISQIFGRKETNIMNKKSLEFDEFDIKKSILQWMDSIIVTTYFITQT